MRTEDDSKRYRNIFITFFSGFEEEITYDKDVNTFQVGYIIISIILVFFGIFGMCLNGWAIYLFTKTKTVSIEYPLYLEHKSLKNESKSSNMVLIITYIYFR